MDGKFLPEEGKICPICGSRYEKILSRDNEMAELEDEQGHRWTVTLQTGDD